MRFKRIASTCWATGTKQKTPLYKRGFNISLVDIVYPPRPKSKSSEKLYEHHNFFTVAKINRIFDITKFI